MPRLVGKPLEIEPGICVYVHPQQKNEEKREIKEEQHGKEIRNYTAAVEEHQEERP